MSKKNTSKKRDNTFKKAVLALGVFAVIMAAVLVINARSLGFIATVDGQRVPMDQFNFQRAMIFDELVDEFGDMAWWIFDEHGLAEFTLESLVRIYNITSNAYGTFGVSLSPDDIALAHAEADRIRENRTVEDIWGNMVDQIAAMGFTRSSFYDFAEKLMIIRLVEEAIFDIIHDELGEEGLAAAFDEFIEENRASFRHPLVYVIEVEDEQEGHDILMTRHVMGGESFSDIITSRLEEGDDRVVEPRRMVEYDRLTDDIWNMVMTGEAGDVIQAMPMLFGGYALIMIDSFEYDLPTQEQFDDFYIFNQVPGRLEHYVGLWRHDSNVSRNNRIFRGFDRHEPEEGDIDWGDDAIDWDDFEFDIEFEEDAADTDVE